MPEVDALDAPVLMYQLVVSLLSQVAPEGPDKLLRSREVSVAESKRAIRVATQSASGRFPAPWSVTGSITKADASRFEYSLTFRYPNEGGSKSAQMLLNGYWTKESGSPAMEDSMDIQGWSLHTIGPLKLRQEGSTILDFGAQAEPLRVHTLGELRKALARDNSRNK